MAHSSDPRAVLDRKLMQLALRLARRGVGRTRPNPPVGAVVAHNGEVVGRGFHRRAGLPHAEVEALREAGERARGGTLYVTLEPCNHTGRTPPCTEAILAAGIRRVVVGVRDPNPGVRGGGVNVLRQAGIEVVEGIEGERCAELVAPFRKWVTSGRPWVTLKIAASLDGKIATATGDSRWITNERSRRYVHRLRDEHDAVLVGAGTVLADDPELTCRRRGGRNPLRVILDGRLRSPLTARVFDTEKAATLVLTSAVAPARKRAQLQARGVEVEEVGAHACLEWEAVLGALGRRGVLAVLVEGGAQVAAQALRQGGVDRLLLFLAPLLIGGDGRPWLASLGVRTIAEALRLPELEVRRFAGDILVATQWRAA